MGQAGDAAPVGPRSKPFFSVNPSSGRRDIGAMLRMRRRSPRLMARSLSAASQAPGRLDDPFYAQYATLMIQRVTRADALGRVMHSLPLRFLLDQNRLSPDCSLRRLHAFAGPGPSRVV